MNSVLIMFLLTLGKKLHNHEIPGEVRVQLLGYQIEKIYGKFV